MFKRKCSTFATELGPALGLCLGLPFSLHTLFLPYDTLSVTHTTLATVTCKTDLAQPSRGTPPQIYSLPEGKGSQPRELGPWAKDNPNIPPNSRASVLTSSDSGTHRPVTVPGAPDTSCQGQCLAQSRRVGGRRGPKRAYLSSSEYGGRGRGKLVMLVPDWQDSGAPPGCGPCPSPWPPVPCLA